MTLFPALLITAALAGPIFVDVDEAQALIAQGAAIIDSRGEKAWQQGHLPGSWPLDWTDHTQGWVRSGLLTEDLAPLEVALEEAGVRDDRPVLVVGAGRSGWGEEGRWFWTLEYLGHPAVHVLDGGLPTWLAAGKPLSRDTGEPAIGAFSPKPHPTRRARIDQVSQATLAGSALVWDTREDREYDGETPYGEARGGHIPGAAGLWYGALLTPEGNLLPEEQLRTLLDAVGIRPGRPIITTCTGGVRSAFAYAVLRDLGYPQVANYDGSMWEWSADGERPLTTARAERP